MESAVCGTCEFFTTDFLRLVKIQLSPPSGNNVVHKPSQTRGLPRISACSARCLLFQHRDSITETQLVVLGQRPRSVRLTLSSMANQRPCGHLEQASKIPVQDSRTFLLSP